MSKFQSTVSTVAALTTIFGASVAAWKVVDLQNVARESPDLQQKVIELERKLKDASATQVTPPAISLPQTTEVPAVAEPTSQPTPTPEVPPPPVAPTSP